MADLPALAQPIAPFILMAVRERSRRQETSDRQVPFAGSWTLLVAEEGGIHFRLAGGGIDIHPGTCVLIHPGRAGTYTQPPCSRYRRIDFDLVHRLRRRNARTNFTWMPLDESPQPDPQSLWGFPIPLILPQALVATTTAMAREVSARWWQDERSQFICNMRLAAWLGVLFEQLAPPAPTSPITAMVPVPGPGRDASGSDDPLIEQAEAFARSDQPMKVHVAAMAASVGMSARAFTRLYLRKRGVSPGAFLREVRYQQAERLLVSTTGSIAKVAYDAGFRSTPTFARGFKARTGLTPIAWRRLRTSGH